MNIQDIGYFFEIIQGGFVFYGGLIGGIGSILIAGKIHKINAPLYIENFLFLLPFIHAFGRIGCFMAGCCYGIQYNGFPSVIFPENSFAPSGVSVFPVQLFEALGLFMISFLIFFIQLRNSSSYSVIIYLFCYSILRFVMENFRDDSIRGSFLALSTSQWISVVLMILSISLAIRKFPKTVVVV